MHPTQNPVSTAVTPTVADTLRRAALYLIRHGWTQDNTYTDEMTPVILRTTATFPAADVLGALVLAVTGQTLIPAEIASEFGHSAAREFDTTANYLSDWLGLSADYGDLYAAGFGPGIDIRDLLCRWNDAPWQDSAHVIDGLLSAAADCDGTVYKPGTHRPYAVDFAALNIKAGAR